MSVINNILVMKRGTNHKRKEDKLKFLLISLLLSVVKCVRVSVRDMIENSPFIVVVAPVCVIS